MVGDFRWNAGTLAACHQDIGRFVMGPVEGLACPGGEKNEAPAFGTAPGIEAGVAVVLDHLHGVEIVHSRAPERGARKREAGWMDDVDDNAQTGAEPEQGAGVECDVGLIASKGYRQGR